MNWDAIDSATFTGFIDVIREQNNNDDGTAAIMFNKNQSTNFHK